ncbi:hypothetical protein POM88_031475 [Heracleum sosnowskyi]|uniref:Putative plant transposon protein domain-containing protein n=1 Tax=Heracleum sosnowskyi TaxID=360622 RepID=A0AAD8HZH5_9APIA|nr:hypothetical protein POM88_031475 [Heracleum sosnowskyi]
MAPPKRGRLVGSSSTRRSSSEEESSAGVGMQKFSSPEAQLEFNRLLAKPVAKERGFLPRSSDGHLLAMITKRGWESFCEAPQPVPLSIVREFYANARADKNGYSVVRGMTVDYTARAIGRVLNLPPKKRGEEDWSLKTREDLDLEYILEEISVPGTSWKYRSGTTVPASFPAAAMNRYARAWNQFLCANVVPSSHTHDVTVERVIILWGILNDDYIDLADLLHRSIVKFLKSNTAGAIPHASVVTKLCVAVGVRWSEEEPVQMPSAPIDHTSIFRMEEWDGGDPDNCGLGYTIWGVEGSEALIQESADRRARATRIPQEGAARIRRDVDSAVLGDVQYRRLTRRIDRMHDIQSRFAQDLTQALGTAFRATGVDIAWPVFGMDSVYPPPDTPPEEGGPADD